jgi:alanine-synthesizing transaminase
VKKRTRAIVAVHPNNPTGSYLLATELAWIERTATAAGCAVVSDEVFYDYPLIEDPFRATAAASKATALTFSLGGLSKSCGLPHYKLGWIRVGGPAVLRRQALDRLETIADNFLSVATPVQAALPELLEIGATIRQSILARIRSSYSAMRALTEATPSIQVLPAEGGWSAVLRIPSLTTDEDFAVGLIERSGVVVQPGYFFDFRGEGFVVVSLLTPEEVLREGVRRIVDAVSA